MIRAIRPQAMAQDDASLVSGWNVSPNVAYTVQLNPGSSACGVLLYNDDQAVIIASGAGLVGTDQPVILHAYSGQTLGMVDADLGWHLLLTTDGTESQRTIRIGPAVDLPDEIHPIYADDGLAVVRARAGVDDHTHYPEDITVLCPQGFGAWIGDVARTPVDGAAIDGQAESIVWTGTPDGVNEQAIVRRYVPIAPDAFIEITPPTVADDTGTATHLAGTSGNVLANDESGLVVTAVNGLAGNVGLATDGNNGGSFTINANGSWTFSPDGDFALLSGTETANTSITYHASDGTAEASATLTITVSHANTAPVAVDDTGTTDAATTTSGNVLTNDTDANLDSLTVSKVNGTAGNVGVSVAGSAGGLFTVGADGAWSFAPNSEFASLTGEQTATTSVTYHVSDGMAEDEGILTVTVSAVAVAAGLTIVGSSCASGAAANFDLALPVGTQSGDLILVFAGFNTTSDGNPGIVTPSGYTELLELYANDSNDTNLSVNYKVADAVEAQTVTVAGSGVTSRGSVAAAVVLRGQDAVSPFDVATVYTILGNTPWANSPAITPVTDGALLLTVGAWSGFTQPLSEVQPVGFDMLDGLSMSGAVVTYPFSLHVATRWWASVDGAVDPSAWAGTAVNSISSMSCIGLTMAIRPAGS